MSALPETPRVLVIVHDVDDNLNELAVPLVQAGLHLETWDVQNDPESTPPLDAIGEYAGIISLGAHAGVRDEPLHEWMRHERRVMERALELEIPLLGLCFGSQLLASVAGGEYVPSPVPELGWTRVIMSPDAAADPVLSALEPELDAFHFHYDSYTLPETAVVLGETNGIIQAFRVGSSAWATQFHPEVGLSQQLAWMTSYRRLFEKEGIVVADEVRKSHELWQGYRDQAVRLGTAFAGQVQAYASR